MSALNEKPEDRKHEEQDQQHAAALDADCGSVLDADALEAMSGGTPGQEAIPLDSVADMYDARRPPKAIGGREGKSGA